jgi:hypothetical protein
MVVVYEIKKTLVPAGARVHMGQSLAVQLEIVVHGRSIFLEPSPRLALIKPTRSENGSTPTVFGGEPDYTLLLYIWPEIINLLILSILGHCLGNIQLDSRAHGIRHDDFAHISALDRGRAGPMHCIQQGVKIFL